RFLLKPSHFQWRWRQFDRLRSVNLFFSSRPMYHFLADVDRWFHYITTHLVHPNKPLYSRCEIQGQWRAHAFLLKAHPIIIVLNFLRIPKSQRHPLFPLHFEVLHCSTRAITTVYRHLESPFEFVPNNPYWNE